MKKNFFLAAALAGLLLLAAGCAAEEEQPETDEAASEEVMRYDKAAEAEDSGEFLAAEEEAKEENGDLRQGREMIVKEGEVHLEADRVDEVSAEVRDLIDEYGGYVENSSFEEGDNGRQQVKYKLRVPAEDFNALLEEVTDLARVQREDVSTEDVTEEYVDLEARRNVLEAQEERLIEMYDEAEDVDDLLALEEELTRLRGQIESIQGRMDYLERVTSYSTLTVFIKQRMEATPQPDNVGEEFMFSFQEGWRIFASTMVTVVAGLLRAWPFLLILAAAAAGVWKVIRGRKHFREIVKEEEREKIN